MALGDDRDLVPLGTGFDIVKRGYSRTQVEEHLERLDGDLRLLAADRDAAVSQAADLARRLEQSRSEIDDLRGQVDRLSVPPTTLEGLSERLQRMLRLAQDEAAETKARAEAEAGHIRARAESDASAARARYEQLILDLDRRRSDMEAEHREVLRKARADAETITEKAENERAEADAVAERRRTKVEDDFEIAMAARRTEAMRTLAEEEATSKAESERRLREAAEEAERARAEIAEEQRTAKAEAERVTEEATATADARLNEATEEAHRRVREATEEANRRINHAGERVGALRELRSRIADQLYSARDLLIDTGPDLGPFDEEDRSEVDSASAEDPSGGDDSQSATQFMQMPRRQESKEDADPDEQTVRTAKPVGVDSRSRR